MKKISSRIRSLRRRQSRTLKEISDRCGFTVSLLSKIESGKVNPPVATLEKIAQALGVSLNQLFTDDQASATSLTQASKLSKQALTTTDKGYGFHLLAAERADKIMQPILFVAEKGKVKAGVMSHSGEEFIYVLKGKMSYQIGEETKTLGPGDSLYFNAEEDHDLEPITAKVEYLAIFAQRPATRKKRA